MPPSHARRFDPLVLDLNGDGVKLTSLNGSKVNFDFGGDGFAEKTGWVSAQTPCQRLTGPMNNL